MEALGNMPDAGYRDQSCQDLEGKRKTALIRAMMPNNAGKQRVPIS